MIYHDLFHDLFHALFKVRLEIRYDWADENVFNGSVDHDQVAIAMDMILTF